MATPVRGQWDHHGRNRLWQFRPGRSVKGSVQQEPFAFNTQMAPPAVGTSGPAGSSETIAAQDHTVDGSVGGEHRCCDPHEAGFAAVIEEEGGQGTADGDAVVHSVAYGLIGHVCRHGPLPQIGRYSGLKVVEGKGLLERSIS
jgi:hypothetical protein